MLLIITTSDFVVLVIDVENVYGRDGNDKIWTFLKNLGCLCLPKDETILTVFTVEWVILCQ